MVQTNKNRGVGYLDHVDGIRCLAVSLVVLYHAGATWFPGGFVGVDVFFVISGFLMTRILLTAKLDFSGLKSFYINRYRRIMPAYAVVLALSALITAVLFIPVQSKEIAMSFLLSPFFLSNVLFWKTTDYFAPDLSYNPLLHTWSLAVEWQFYLVFPFIFIVLRNHRKFIPAAIAILGIVSFAVSFSLVEKLHLIPAFYLLPSRVFEFVIGSMVVFVPDFKLKGKISSYMAYLGLILIFFCVATYNKETMFPGISALLPCLGAAILIYFGGEPGVFNELLNFYPVKMIGKMSYSVYLFHWPLIVFTEYFFPPHALERNVFFIPYVIYASLFLGFCSWKYVEAPFRAKIEKSARPKRTYKTYAAYGLLVAPLVIGAIVLQTNGFPHRFAPGVVAVGNAYTDVGEFRKCLDKLPDSSGDIDALCRLGDPSATRSFLVLGDSHAAALADGISHLASSRGEAGLLSATDACAPLLEFPGGYIPTRVKCQVAQAGIPRLISYIHPDAVILHARWTFYYQKDPKKFVRSLDDTLAYFKAQNVRVIVIGDTPGARDQVPVNLAKHFAYGIDDDLAFSTQQYLRFGKNTADILRLESERFDFTYIDTADKLCVGGSMCQITHNGLPLYWDSHHLTGQGSRYVVSLISYTLPQNM